ncbi:inhibitor of growth proteins N-terminal histone-binding-domain-containing protein [Chaetomium tenue]|uniref:Inhibitor of growth proteins N-terminal histone-binding-domain-containing protein n=1 Tax=Chaetomium tenue TaxID=1854479 RepID=A0ACB7PPF9_9PEZI|nr:inhibitor of growth proteins N-terminal histone-binding-domain-containing protein [Chaetomium globosum]
MPRDDLSIDFVRKMPPVEAADPALVLDEYFNRTQNFPEELRFVQEEIAEKDRQYKELIQEIEDRDGRIQKWIKAHGSHHPNPKEEEYRTTIRKNYAQAEQLSNEKIALTQKLLHNMDKHTRQLDMQIKMLYDRGEPGFTDPDELPSLIRSSAANGTTGIGGPRGANGTTPATSALNNLASGPQVRAANAQVRHAQAQQHGSASAPATPAASMIMNRQARESSAGPATKRMPRSNSGLGTLPATSSGLARHSSLGPGTPKGHQTATGVQRAGSAGPRATSKGTLAGGSRKAGTPSSTSGRKKGTPAVGSTINKSGLSRVKRAAKNSPSSAAESELSDADSASDSASDTRTGGRGTPAASFSRSTSNQAALPTPSGVREASNPHRRTPSGPSTAASNHPPHSGGSGSGSGGGGGGGGGERQHGTRPSPHPRGGGGGGGGVKDEDDLMDVDDDEAGDDRKYCSCQNVSFGNMVACDNDHCPYEWFHWGCVGLKSEPNGTWYCPECSEKLRKR